MKPFCVLCVILLASSIVFADQVMLKNGDRLTGTIVKSDGKNLVLKSEFAGEVTIQWDAVQGLTSAGDLHLDLKNGQKIAGQVSTADGQLVVATKAQGNVSAPIDSVAIIRNTNEQLAYDKSLHPGLREGWTGGTTVGFALTRGNSQTKNLSLAFDGARKTLNDKLAVYANTVYATNDAPGAVPTVTANAIQGGIRYDHDISKRLFASAAPISRKTVCNH